MCSILSAKVQQQNALEIKKEKQIIQTQEEKPKYIYNIHMYLLKENSTETTTPTT